MTYEELKEALLELNNDLEFDDEGYYQYHEASVGSRSSISWNGEHICNVDTGDIPEETLMGRATTPTMIHPDLRDYNTTHTKKMVVFDDNPLFFEADQLLGKKQLDVVTLGVDYTCMAQRATSLDYRKATPKPEDCIILRFYFELKEQDNLVIKIGWQKPLQSLIKSEAITKEAIEKKLDIVIGD